MRAMVPGCGVIVMTLAACAVEPAPEGGPPEAAPVPEVRYARVRTLGGVQEVPYRLIDGVPMVGDDAALRLDLLEPGPEHAGGAVPANFSDSIYTWAGNVVPYALDSSFTPAMRASLDVVIEDYWRMTPIRFVPRTSQYNWIIFQGDAGIAGCGLSNMIGRAPPGSAPLGYPQVIKIRVDTCSQRVYRHEIGHALGLFHEQTRPDRDANVVIYPTNISDSTQFARHDSDEVQGSINGPYDLTSIMHYASGSFQTDAAELAGFPTVTTLAGGCDTRTMTGPGCIPSNNRFSDGDLRAIAAVYPPPAATAPSMCLTARVHAASPRRRVDLAEAYDDRGDLTSVAIHPSNLWHGTDSFSEEAQPIVPPTPPRDWANRDGGFSVNHRWMAGDFDGDGDQDLATAWNDAGLNTVAVRKSSGSAFVLQPSAWKLRDGTWVDSSIWIPGDFNGDTKTDIAVVWLDGGLTTVSVALSTGSGFGGWTEWAKRDGGWPPKTRWNTGDFNNDGRDDLVAVWQNGTVATITVRLSSTTNLNHFAAPAHWLANSGGWADTTVYLAGNFDGTGGTDLMGVWNDAGHPTFAFFKSNGGSFAGPVAWLTRDQGWAPNARWAAGDFNADGFDDIAAAWNDAGMSTIAVRASVVNLAIPGGRGLSGAWAWATRRAGWQDWSSWCAGDFDADLDPPGSPP